MTQSGQFFNGTTLGDAVNAPYGESLFTFPTKFYGNFVIPEYGNELLLSSNTPTNGQVKVATGGAMVNGFLYENTAVVTVAITAAVNNRIDRIILRPNTVGNTVRITKVIGAEAANPSPPAINTTDLELGQVYVPAGYNPATTPVAEVNVHDQRLFFHTGILDPFYSTENIMPNSEFFGYSGGAAGNLPPDGWLLSGVPTTSIGNVILTNFPNQPRGQAVRIVSNAAQGMITRVYTRPSLGGTKTLVYTLKGALYIASGSVAITMQYEDSAGNIYGTVTRNYNRVTTNFDFLIRTSIPDSFADFVFVKITILANSAGSDFSVGQLILTRGYVPGNYRPKHEIVYFDNDVIDAAWNTTAKSSSTTTINVAASFGAVIPPYFRGLICRIRGRDSGSAAAGPGYVSLGLYHPLMTTSPTGFVNVEGLVNDVSREQVVYVPTDHASANAPIVAIVAATGANTFDATIRPIGIIT